jgi:hypothetical protein
MESEYGCWFTLISAGIFEEHHLRLFETQASLLSEEEIAPSTIFLKGGLPISIIRFTPWGGAKYRFHLQK